MSDTPSGAGSQALPAFIYGTAWKEGKTEELVGQALRSGFRAIDTANQRKHYFEEAVGNGITKAIEAEILSRAELFLQTKYTFLGGQDDRLPYDPASSIETQVAQSFESSLLHLQTDYMDSFVLHGPSSRNGLTENDWAAWRGMEDIHASERVRNLGVSNVNLEQLRILCDKALIPPRFVQNRCYASKAWDKDIRQFCSQHDIVYQGFSLLTANRQILRHPTVLEIGKTHRMSISQTIFRYAMDAGMIPLTGTSNADHMAHDLLAVDYKLSDEEVDAMENLTGKS